MTDEQIIKAVGICRTQDTCRGCPYHELYTAACVSSLMKDVFDLINRRKAEIERLTAKILVKDNINDYNTAQLRIAREELRTTKSEAIKEFAKRLKSKLNDLELRTKTQRKTVTIKFCDDNANWVMHECIPEEIDKLVKEMTEVQE